ncbi:MAG: flavodoxin family protein [Bacteroidales bacterium]|nr:MAG: flavodoxin family protein [Bacteroidales bacterium]
MKRVLGIMGSPRINGNTHILVNKILEGAKDKGAETEIVFLKDLEIKECDGCYTCWKGRECSKEDDMNSLYPKLIESDIIVFGTPVYWYGPTALMKAFIDRFVYFNCDENRAKIRGKLTTIAVPFEEESLETARLLIEFFEKSFSYLQLKLARKIIVPGVYKKGDILAKKDFMDKAYKCGFDLV